MRVRGSLGLKLLSDESEKGSALIETDSSTTARVEAAETLINVGLMLGAADAGETAPKKITARPAHTNAAKRSLEEDNSKLRAELVTYRGKENAYLLEQDENAHLRELVGFAAHMPGNAAAVISSVNASPYGTFLIDAGSGEGSLRGLIVYTGDGFALGRVSDTMEHSSLVSELFAPDSKLEAIAGDASLVLTGEGGGNARAKVPRESTIKVGDIVRAPSVNAPVGIVGHISTDPTQAYIDVYVIFPSNLQTLTYVYVGRK